MKVADCFAYLAERWRQELVVCALGTSSREWYAATGSDRPFYMLSSMGLASSFGLAWRSACAASASGCSTATAGCR